MSLPLPAVGPDHLNRVVRVVSSLSSLPAIATHDWCERAANALTGLHPGISAVVTIGVFGADGKTIQLESTGGAPNLDEDSLSRIRTGSLGWWLSPQPTDRAGARVRVLSLTPDHSAWASSAAGMAWSRSGVNDLVVGLIPLHHANENRMLSVEIGLPAGAAFDAGRLSVVLTAMLPELARRAVAAFGTQPLDPLNRITPREQEVMELLTLGDSVKEIAEKLSRSPHTVHDHVKSLHRKLGATSRGELVARALGHAPTFDNQFRRTLPRVRESGDPSTSGGHSIFVPNGIALSA